MKGKHKIMNLNSINSCLRFPLGGAMVLAMLAAMPARADYQSTVLDQNPVGYWRLNETTQPPAASTTTANQGSLGSSANGTYIGNPARALPGPFAGSVAVGLSGTAQSVTTPWQAGLNPNAFSAELWVNPAQVPFGGSVSYVASSVQVASPRSGWYLAQDNGSTFGAGSAFVVRLFNQNGTTPTTQLAAPILLPLGSWYHLVLTYDGTTATLYENGVAVTNNTAAYVGNVDNQTTFGCRGDNAYYWPGQQAEVAMYGVALSAAQVAAHYSAGTTAPATYAATVQADSPLLWYRFLEAPDVAALNSSTAGSALNGTYAYGTTPGATGPRPAAYPGFDAANYAVSLPGTGPNVAVPATNLSTNTVTISGWVNASTISENGLSGIIMCHAGTTYSGLNIDWKGGLGLGYTWNNDGNTYNWAPSTDAVPPLPTLPASDWAFIALVVQPDKASVYVCASNNPAGFAGATNIYTHVNQAFDGQTLIGSDGGDPGYSFAGKIDEVAIWNRALGVGELYTQYGAAAGGAAVRIFGDLQGPTDPVAAGDPVILSVDAGGTPPLTFTWHMNGGTVATTSNSTLVIASSTLSDSGTYDVTITNALGSAQSASVAVSVVVPSQPTIVGLQGYQSRTLYPTGTLSMAVSATGGGLKYQWYKNASPVASATSSAYTIAHVVAADAGSYSVGITNVVGTATSGPPAVIAIATIAAGSYEAAIINSLGGAPEAWWRLDEPAGSTNMFDGMGNHDGVYTNASGGATLPTLGATGALVNDPNTAATFSSTGQGIGLVPFSPALNPSKFSVEAWVNTTVMDGQAPVSSCYGTGPAGWWMQSISGWWYGDCGGGYFGNNNNENTLAAIIPDQWSHIVITYDPTSNATYPYDLWVNGASDGYIWGAGTFGINGAGPFIIGARGVSATVVADRFFDGKVDEVAFYRRLLTGAEILAHYAARGTVNIPVTFTKPLLSQTVTTGKSISFSTSVLGTTPISLQWYKDGKSIQDATNSTFAIASTALGDAGTYTLWGTNVVGPTNISASLVVISPVAYANVTNNLVLHLRFDGDTTDTSGQGNDGTPSSPTAPTFVSPAIIGSQALHYETIVVTNAGVSTNIQSTSYVTVGTVGSGPPTELQFGASTSFSVSLWVKLDAGALPADVPFIGTATNSSFNAGWDLSPSFHLGGWQWNLNDGVALAGNNVNVNGADGSINDGNWHNFVLTVDRTAKVADSYLDGVHTASASIAALGSIDNNNYWPIVIGQDPSYAYEQAGYGPFAVSATLDDIGIWRQALTALDAAQIASAGSTGGRSFDTVAPSGGTQPDITGISVSAGTVTIQFTAGASDPSTAFTLLGAGTANGSYGPAVGAVITGSAGSYTATVPTSGAMQFYRIQR
jgi:hypothetical protein